METITNDTELRNTGTTTAAAVTASTEVLRVVKYRCGCTSHKCLVKGNRAAAGCTRECAGCKDAFFVVPCGKHSGKKITEMARRIRQVEVYN